MDRKDKAEIATLPAMVACFFAAVTAGQLGAVKAATVLVCLFAALLVAALIIGFGIKD